MNIQQQEVQIELTKLIDNFLGTDIIDGKFGWLPENISETMAAAAFNVLLAVKGTNDYLIDEGMLKQ